MNFTPCACSSMIVRIWSSCAEPVPPIFMVPFFSFTAATYSFAVLYGAAAGAGGNDELDGLGGLPRGGGSRQERSGQEHEEQHARRDLSHRCLPRGARDGSARRDGCGAPAEYTTGPDAERPAPHHSTD